MASPRTDGHREPAPHDEPAVEFFEHCLGNLVAGRSFGVLWEPKLAQRTRAAMSRAACGGRMVGPVIEEDF